MTDYSRPDSSGGRVAEPVLVARMLVAVVQAAALYLLLEAAEAGEWPASEAWLFEPLLLISAYIPVILLFGAGSLPVRPLALWTILATLVVAGLGYHDAVRDRAAEYPGEEVFWPLPRLCLALAAGLFVAHVLVSQKVLSGRWRASYPDLFETSWKIGVQGVLAAGFLGVFWGILHLGAGLFALIEVTFFERLIERLWFVLPATTLALAVSLHVTDVQPSLIRGARTVALLLFSWLLPLLAVILLGFLGSLAFISLEPLWNTRSAATLLLLAAGLLVFLVNSSYQDGLAGRTASGIRRYAPALGAFELLPLSGLAAWALHLRVEQYGWTVERILAAAVIHIAACYALGYALAAVRSPGSMKGIEKANFAVAWIFLLLLLAVYTPVADPSRLMVASQLARLESGTVQPERFDFAALKFDGARWGRDALEGLSRSGSGPEPARVQAKAKEALSMDSRYRGEQPFVWPPEPARLAARVSVYPAGQELPVGFYESLAHLEERRAPLCLRVTMDPCMARFVELSPGSEDTILLLDSGSSYLYRQETGGAWRVIAQLEQGGECAALRRGVEQNRLRAEPPQWPDLVVEDRRFRLRPPLEPDCR